jgi:hypothetical protein
VDKDRRSRVSVLKVTVFEGYLRVASDLDGKSAPRLEWLQAMIDGMMMAWDEEAAGCRDLQREGRMP